MNRNLKTTAALIALIALTLSLASCGGAGSGTGSDRSDSNGSSQNASKKSTKKSALAYSQCMRDNGVKNFPDPDDSGQIKLHAEPGNGLDFADPTFKKADQACKPLMPGPSKKERAESRKAALQFAKCMRKNGVRNFPDPPAGEGPQVQQGGPGSENQNMDPNDPTFKKAEQACRHLAEAIGGEHGLSPKGEK